MYPHPGRWFLTRPLNLGMVCMGTQASVIGIGTVVLPHVFSVVVNIGPHCTLKVMVSFIRLSAD
jgi:bacteriorhodopsin